MVTTVWSDKFPLVGNWGKLGLLLGCCWQCFFAVQTVVHLSQCTILSLHCLHCTIQLSDFRSALAAQPLIEWPIEGEDLSEPL